MPNPVQFFRANLLAGFLALSLACASVTANAGWVSSPGMQSLALGNPLQGAGTIDDSYDFTLNFAVQVSYTTHRYVFGDDFPDFSAILFKILPDHSQVPVAGGLGIDTVEKDVDQLTTVGYSNDFGLSSLAAGDYRLRITGTDPLGLGYTGSISVFFAPTAGNPIVEPRNVPEPPMLAITLVALFALAQMTRRIRPSIKT